MTDATGTRRATRRNLSTQPVPRESRNKPGQRLLYTPLTPDEVAWMIDQARAQRIEESIAKYSKEKTA